MFVALCCAVLLQCYYYHDYYCRLMLLSMTIICIITVTIIINVSFSIMEQGGPPPPFARRKSGRDLVPEFTRKDSKPKKGLQEHRAIPCALWSLMCIIALCSRSLFLGLESLLVNLGISLLNSMHSSSICFI